MLGISALKTITKDTIEGHCKTELEGQGQCACPLLKDLQTLTWIIQ